MVTVRTWQETKEVCSHPMHPKKADTDPTQIWASSIATETKSAPGMTTEVVSGEMVPANSQLVQRTVFTKY